MTFLQARRTAQIQYHGESGITQSCIDAVVRLVQCGEWITKAFLLTCGDRHCFYLELHEHEEVLIRPAFASGYSGESPAGLAVVLLLFRQHEIDVEEIEVPRDFMVRADESRLTLADLEMIGESRAIRPIRTGDYIYGVLDQRGGDAGALKKQYPLVVPFGLVDARIMDLALMLPNDPDSAIFKAYRRLEEHVSRRCGDGGHGFRLLKLAFHGPESKLTWTGLPQNEANGRADFFLGGFSAYRNARAHRQLQDDPVRALREFLLVNELFLLESEAACRSPSDDSEEKFVERGKRP